MSKSYEEKLADLIRLNDLHSIINHSFHLFPKSFINNRGEIILEPKNNVFFRIDNVHSTLDFKCKILAWVSRPIAKELNRHWSYKLLNSVNRLLDTNFSKDDMYKIYDRLGNDVNRQLSIQFIESGYDMKLLERKEMN